MQNENDILIYQSPQTWNFICQYFAQTHSLTKWLNERKHRLITNGASYQLIDYWEKEGLFTAERSADRGWRKYSLIDLTWLMLLSKLRKFGYPIEGLKKLKGNLTENHPIHNTESFVDFEAYLAMAILLKVPTYINVLPDGIALLTTYEEKRALEQNKIFIVNSSVSISLNHLLSEITKKDFYPVNSDKQLTSEEVELLTHIRTGDYISINVRLKNGKIDIFDLVDEIDFDPHLMKLLKRNKYLELRLVQRNGEVVKFERTVQKKVNAK